MTASTITIAACAGGCGRTMERETATGPLAEVANALPLICAQCGERQERELADEQAERAARQAKSSAATARAPAACPARCAHVDLDQLDPAGCAGDRRGPRSGRCASSAGCC
jgi:hypothetical protein